MDRLEAMRIFVRVAERRSFTAAAQDLGLPRSTVTSAVKTLESRLGVSLLNRTTRVVNVTLDGERYHRRCRDLLSDMEELEASFSEVPRGALRVDVHGTLANHFLWPHLPEFLSRYPEIELQIGEGDRLVDLIREGVDCALRVGELSDSDMIARRVAMLREVTCASPRYLEQYGIPKSPDDLSGHKMVGFYSSARSAVLPLDFTVNSKIREVILPSPVTVVAASTFKTLCAQGMGLIQLPRYHVESEIKNGLLIPVLREFDPAPTPVSLLYPRNAQFALRIRVFIDWVKDMFSASVDDEGLI